MEASSLLSVLGDNPKERYRELAKLVHPDVVEEHLKPRAQLAFEKINSAFHPSTTDTVVAGFKVRAAIGRGSVCDVFSTDPRAVMKVARSEADSDLMDAEALTLTAANDSFYGEFFPVLLKSTTINNRRANIISEAIGCYSLKEIVALKGPSLRYEHRVWMVSRSLMALGYLHNKLQRVHGAIFPEHLFFRPKDRGMLMLDWCYSVPIGKPVLAVVDGKSGGYPIEVIRKQPSGPWTDINMLAQASLYECDVKTIPKSLIHMIDWMLASSPMSRPTSAFDTLDRWRAAAKLAYGAPKFEELTM